jgi:hypothetical protein
LPRCFVAFESVLRFLILLIAGLQLKAVGAAAVPPRLDCQAPVMLFAATGTRLTGVREPGRDDFLARLETFATKACGGSVAVSVITDGGDRLRERLDSVVELIGRVSKGVAILHFPYADAEAGSGVDDLLSAYRTVLDVCRRSGVVCILGGQQPIHASNEEMVARQQELERRAAAEFGAAYLPLYRHLQSRWEGRRLMTSIDSGDGRSLDVFGHELLFRLYRRALLLSVAGSPPDGTHQPVNAGSPSVR